jgi:precorrin-6B methylase 2
MRTPIITIVSTTDGYRLLVGLSAIALQRTLLSVERYSWASSKPSNLTAETYRPGLAEIGLAFIIFGVAFGIFTLGTVVVGAGYEPTSRRKVRKMLEMSGAGPSDVVYDLGSGDGRVVVEAAKNYHARAVGVEADPIRVLYSRLAVSRQHLGERARIVWGNFFHMDLREATIVTMFLTQGTNQRLKAKLMAELRPGTKVVSYVWTFNDWMPALKDSDDKISMYVVPS